MREGEGVWMKFYPAVEKSLSASGGRETAENSACGMGVHFAAKKN